MPNALTRTAGLRVGSIALDTLFKHYIDRLKKEKAEDDPSTQLRQHELLYDEAFNIAKRFFDVATHHSVEELQAFSNTRIPSPPWVHVVRVTVPMSSCDEAAALLIQAFGSEEHMFLLVGGTKWWQVRGVTGIAGEWVTARKDWEAVKKRRKASQKTGNNTSSQDAADAIPSSTSESSNPCDEDANDLRCILFAHGGGYYFGSFDQERFCIQRLARKIKGRVFAVSYRLAPQYPFPCALQDLVAAYLYMIKPPPDAPHQPIKPSHIVVAGDSAGGGLTFALLQILRDTGQPLPAGGVLISPWCDLTHSFPSIHSNTATDVIPLYGLSLHKPSALWPPPSEEMTRKIHIGLRQKLRQIVRATIPGDKSDDEVVPEAQDGPSCPKRGDDEGSVLSHMPIDVGATVSLPSVDERNNQTISLQTKSGELLKIDSQLQLYTQNSLLGHPLVSPALSYLGGLPPLLVIASDKEVLRDEIIYSAHKAGDPSRFPLKDEARALYPPLVGIETRYGPTQVHLQIYDDTAHVLPVLFPFTTPAKYCYRTIATFTKHVTGMLPSMELTPSSSEVVAPAPRQLDGTPMDQDISIGIPIRQVASPASGDLTRESPDAEIGSRSVPGTLAHIPDSSNPPPSFSWPVFLSFQKRSLRATMSRSASDQPVSQAEGNLFGSQNSQSAGGPGTFQPSMSITNIMMAGVRYAGEASVYYDSEGLPSWKEGMICERVSTQGIIRPLEPSDKIDALHVPPEFIGVLSEKAIRRYLEGKALFDKKHAKESMMVERTRKRNIDLAKKDTNRSLTQLQLGRTPGKQKETSLALKDGLELSTGPWGWALADERPPPSSIVSRRDTDESRRLARIADQSVFQDETQMPSDSLLAVMVNFLTTSSPKQHPVSDSEALEPPVDRLVVKKSKSVFASLRMGERQ